MSILRNEKKMHWASVISLCNESGLSASKYCRENKLCLKSFYRWKKKFGNEVPIAEGFKELSNPTTEGSGLWFDFGNGARLVIDNGFNQTTFKKLMGALIEC